MSDRERYYRFYNANDAHRWGRQEMPEQHAVTRQWLLQTFPANPHAVVLELGCGVGALSAIHPNYIGLDFSFVALQKFATGARHINGDMQALPFKDNSVDFMFSWAALEHVPYPEDVLTEVERVLKAGGVALLAPAWNVRTWAAKGLPVRSYRELSWGDRLRKMAIPLLNSLPWRAFFAVPRRLYRELRAWRHRAPSTLGLRLHKIVAQPSGLYLHRLRRFYFDGCPRRHCVF